MCEPGLHKHNRKDGYCAGAIHLSGIKDGGLRTRNWIVVSVKPYKSKKIAYAETNTKKTEKSLGKRHFYEKTQTILYSK